MTHGQSSSVVDTSKDGFFGNQQPGVLWGNSQHPPNNMGRPLLATAAMEAVSNIKTKRTYSGKNVVHQHRKVLPQEK